MSLGTVLLGLFVVLLIPVFIVLGRRQASLTGKSDGGVPLVLIIVLVFVLLGRI